MLGLKTIRKIKVLNRFNHIIFAFISLGLGHLVYESTLRKHLPILGRINYKKRYQNNSDEIALRLRKTLERLGPVYVKFGQILSTRSDILPKEYIAQLELLQNNVPPFSYDQAVQIIESNFGKPVNRIFKTFEKTPFASASLGQVYRATLKTGEKVAVKVQRPNAKYQIKIDIEVLYLLAHLLEKYEPQTRDYNLKGIIDEFTKWTLNELDYRKEAANCEIFANFFKDSSHIYSPKVYWDYSAESVLTLEYIEGLPLLDVIAGKYHVDRASIAHKIADSFILQCFDFGFFHADPHPGNIFVVNHNQIMFLDFGMVGLLDNRLSSLSTSMFLSLLQKDVENMVTLFLQIEQNYGEGKKEIAEKVDVNKLRKELNELIIQWPVSKNQKGGFTRLFYQIVSTAVKNGVSVPTDFIMLSKAIVTLDRVIIDLDPEFELEKWEEPLLQKIIQKKLEIKNIKSKVQSAALIFEDLIEKLPESSSKILANLEQNRKNMELTPDQLLNYERLMNANSKLNTYGVLVAAVVVASALVYNSLDQPFLAGFSLPQIVLFICFIFIGILIISNHKKGLSNESNDQSRV